MILFEIDSVSYECNCTDESGNANVNESKGT